MASGKELKDTLARIGDKRAYVTSSALRKAKSGEHRAADGLNPSGVADTIKLQIKIVNYLL